MKNYYPKYAQGELRTIWDNLDAKSKSLISEFIQKCRISVSSPKKIDKIKRNLLQFRDITELSLDNQNKTSVNSFLVVLNESKRSGWTKHETKVYVKKFLKWAYKDLELIENIKGDKRDRKVTISENDLITEQEFIAMLQNAETPKQKALLTLFYESGARPQEILNLRWKDLVFEETHVNIKLYSNKTGDTRSFPCVKAKEFLWSWKQNSSNSRPSDLIFPSPRSNEKPLTSAAINKMIRIIAKKSGIEKDVWNYLFRHSRATKLYEDLPQNIVEKLLGHKDMASIYAHISNKKASEKLLDQVYKIKALPQQEAVQLQEQMKKIQNGLNFLASIIADKNRKNPVTLEEIQKFIN